VATESTNADGKSGSGRMVFFVLIAIAVVLFILGVTDSYTQDGPNIHPMDQFIVEPLFGDGPVHWYTPTNVTLWMALSVAAIAALMVMGTGGRAVIPSRSQSMAELAYGFVRKMVEDVAGKDALPFFPYIMTLFMFIMTANILGLIPMSLHHHLAYRGDGDAGARRSSSR
jgi:F-type H+-transporting ATPase subunit a